VSVTAPRAGGLVTAGETMGLIVQSEPGSPRDGEPMTFRMAGSESNVAIGIRRLGVAATWIGRVGADPSGELIQRELRAEDVRAIVTTDPAPTGLMIRWRPTPMHGRVDYYRRASAGAQLQPSDIPAEVVAAAAAFHATGITLALGAAPAAAVASAMETAHQAARIVSFDFNYRRALWSPAEAAPALLAAVRGADVVFAGPEEASVVTGTADPLAAALALEQLGPAQVLIKLGADGCLARIDGTTMALAAPAVTVVDTVGAGDAFVAGYLAELIAGADPARRLATAVAVGAFAVTSSGDWEGLPTRASLALLDGADPVLR
jgi:2-dehydro-3-deoxygluconokinase